VENLCLIFGLGNPGEEYIRTRHNAGFLVVERLALKWKALDWRTEAKFQARLGRGEFEGKRFCLVEPLTYMNESGLAVARLQEYFKVPLNQVLVVVDDADLPFGEIRMRADGSAGGHHGLESIESHLETRQYARLRVGIGRKTGDGRQIKDYVLGNFAKGEMDLLEKILDRAARQVETWLLAGIAKAMSQFNGVVATPATKES
jgi:PTH1 family peptidyl-tRNA hydrolase